MGTPLMVVNGRCDGGSVVAGTFIHHQFSAARDRVLPARRARVAEDFTRRKLMRLIEAVESLLCMLVDVTKFESPQWFPSGRTACGVGDVMPNNPGLYWR